MVPNMKSIFSHPQLLLLLLAMIVLSLSISIEVHAKSMADFNPHSTSRPGPLANQPPEDDDDDFDGIPDAEEGTRDTDGDGIPDFVDNDSDMFAAYLPETGRAQFWDYSFIAVALIIGGLSLTAVGLHSYLLPTCLGLHNQQKENEKGNIEANR